MNLETEKCKPCRGGTEPLCGEALGPYRTAIDTEWTVVEEHHLERTFHFPDFAAALAFVNEVGALAEAEQHHPVIEFTWGEVIVRLWTHKIDGLHPNDFILAARIDAIPRKG